MRGLFGEQALSKDTGELVAIKKVFQDPRYKNRELQIVKELVHPNVINTKQFFYTKGEKVRSSDRLSLARRFDFCGRDECLLGR